MIIENSARSEDFISLVREDRNDAGHQYSVFSVSASLDGQRVTNNSVVLLDTDAFLRSLASFERTRDGACKLAGTEDFFIALDPDGRSGAAWLEFHVCKFQVLVSARTGAGRQTGRILVNAGFTIPGESIGQLVRDFGELLRLPATA